MSLVIKRFLVVIFVFLFPMQVYGSVLTGETCDVYGIANFKNNKLNIFSIYRDLNTGEQKPIQELYDIALSSDIAFKSDILADNISCIQDDGLYLIVFGDKNRQPELIRYKRGVVKTIDKLYNLVKPNYILKNSTAI